MTSLSDFSNRALKSVLAGIAVGLLAWAALFFTRGGGGIAAVWLPNGFILALILHKQEDAWPLTFAALVGVTAGCLLGGRSLVAAPLLGLANAADVLVVWSMLRRLSPDQFAVSDLSHLLKLWLLSGFLAPAIMGWFGALVLSWETGAAFPDLFRSWVLTHGLGSMIVAPSVCVISRALSQAHVPTWSRASEWGLILAVVGVGTAVLFAQSTYPLLFLVSPLVLLGAFRLGSLGTVAIMVVVSTVALAFTLQGSGPVTLVGGGVPAHLQLLQVFVWVNYMIGFTVAAALAGRDRARAEAEAAALAKARFLANMSHEIRTPMNAVIGFTELLLASDLTEKQRRQTSLVADSGKAMMSLLNDILDLSKVDAGQMTVEHAPIDLRHVLQGPVNLMMATALEKGVELSMSVAPEAPGYVLGDGLRIRQVVLNLLGNALKFTNQGSVTVRVAPTPEKHGMLTIEVIDTGIGIPNDRLAAIFDEFEQAKASTVSRFGGTGLGLAITKKLVGLMGGDIRVTSEEGCGSVFEVTISAPAVSKPVMQGQPARAAAGEQPSKDHERRILLVEDHDINQEFMLDLLAKLQVRADLAVNGVEAIERVRTAAESGTPYHLVLMDMQMPVMGGLEATAAIRAGGFTSDRLPIVALSANAYHDDIRACMAAGMQAHLAKPIGLEQLQVALTRWCRVDVAAQAGPPGIDVNGMSRLRERYIERRDVTLESVEKLAATPDVTDEAVTDLIALLHKLAGSAGMFGERALGEWAAVLEDGLRSWPPNERQERTALTLIELRQAA
ncbi:ATP-binding protein [Sphingomonas xinjiangensis]|uniref:Sensory/regulatory protein RpfC n=1 Tax=Sphingomonas xinjiangensis TaxID=643568 RepID=A0A840YTU2_9SPHN|nr:ATP-binding protein [Sphingomonas xinjiangensis]MBB5713104.1 signal transduction histidine kinase/DNA-binding response OmpR family regulator [Sphingomonas xinjiangensis]